MLCNYVNKTIFGTSNYFREVRFMVWHDMAKCTCFDKRTNTHRQILTWQKLSGHLPTQTINESHY